VKSYLIKKLQPIIKRPTSGMFGFIFAYLTTAKLFLQ